MPETPSGGTNSRPLNDTIAQSGPGIPDEGLAEGQDLPKPTSDRQVEDAARALGVDQRGTPAAKDRQ